LPRRPHTPTLFPYTTLFRSKSTGKISDIYVSVGQQVTAGQPLAKLDTTDLEAALAQAQANLVSAQNNYNRTASTTSDAQKALNQDRKSTRLNSSHVSISYAV